MKIIIVGDAGSGKSSIIHFYENNKRNYLNNITIGVDKIITNVKIIDKNNKEINIKLSIWDTAGQEAYNSLVNLYYKDSIGVILVYDITNKKSFYNLDKWLNNITNNNKNIKSQHIILIGNKSDLNKERKISYNDAHDFMQKKQLGGYIETSAHTGYNIKHIFIKLSQELYNSYNEQNSFTNNNYIIIDNKKNKIKCKNCNII